MSKNKIAVIIIVVLALLLGVGLILNQQIVKENKALLDNVEIKIIDQGAEVGTISYEEIVALGAEEYEAVYDTSKTDPVMETYKGVQLYKILQAFDIPVEEREVVTLTAVDNFAMAYSMEEVLQEENMYITFERNGEVIQGKEQDDAGPLVAIIKSDQFSNRRCKWLVSVEVQ